MGEAGDFSDLNRALDGSVGLDRNSSSTLQPFLSKIPTRFGSMFDPEMAHIQEALSLVSNGSIE